jgi:hypothetical protein
MPQLVVRQQEKTDSANGRRGTGLENRTTGRAKCTNRADFGILFFTAIAVAICKSRLAGCMFQGGALPVAVRAASARRPCVTRHPVVTYVISAVRFDTSGMPFAWRWV